MRILTFYYKKPIDDLLSNSRGSSTRRGRKDKRALKRVTYVYPEGALEAREGKGGALEGLFEEA